jgi:hypothetical protein
MRTYLQLRRDLALRRRLLDEVAWLKGEAVELEQRAGGGSVMLAGE